MKTNKNILWVGLSLVLGLFLGYLIFSSGTEPTETTHEHTEVSQTTWTCSMHPQIRQSEPGKCPICGMDLIPLSASNTGSDSQVIQLSEGDLAVGNVETAVVGSGDPGTMLRLNGRVVPSESRIFTQVSHVPGRIEDMRITSTGALLKKGDLIGNIYSPELITAQKEFLEAAARKNKDGSLYEAARQKLRNWKIPNSLINELESSGKVRESFPLIADVQGIILERMVNPGDHLKPGSPIFRVADLSKVWVEFDAYSDQLSSISKGDQVEFTIDGIRGKTFTRPVEFIDPFVNPKTRVARVRVEVENKDLQLLPDQFAVGIVKGSSSDEDALVIPRTAIIWTGENSLVYVRVPGSKSPEFALREIRIGETSGDQVQVLDGLEPGEEIVVKGVFTVDAAAQLAGVRSMMTESDHGEMEMGSAEMISLPKDEWASVFEQYILLKNALVGDDLESAKRSAKKAADMVMDPSLKKDLRSISNAVDLDQAREGFYKLSRSLVTVAQQYGGLEDTIYVQHCPMANKNQGAMWLSLEEEVKNPYFGPSMLTCGSVIQVIQNQINKK